MTSEADYEVEVWVGGAPTSSTNAIPIAPGIAGGAAGGEPEFSAELWSGGAPVTNVNPLYVTVAPGAAFVTPGAGSMGFTPGSVIIANAAGALDEDPGLTFDSITNILTAVGGLVDTPLTPGRVVIVGASDELTDDAGLIYNATTNALSAGAFVPTDATVPANGMYLPAANMVGFAAGSALRLVVKGVNDATDVGSPFVRTDGTYLVISGRVTGNGALYLNQDSTGVTYIGGSGGGAVVGGSGVSPPLATGGLTVYGAASQKTAVFRANATTPGNVIEVQNSAGTPVFGVNSSGQVGVGIDVNAASFVRIGGANAHPGTASTLYGAQSTATYPSTTTVAAYAFYSNVRSAAASFTMSSGVGFEADVGTIGAGSTITTLIGFEAQNQGATGITNAYGLVVRAQSGAATLNVGIRSDGGTTANLWLNSDTASAAGGIAFGTARDVNLYRSAADTLKTDDTLIVVAPAVGSPGVVVRGLASQTAALLRLQDSGGAVTHIEGLVREDAGNEQVRLKIIAHASQATRDLFLINDSDNAEPKFAIFAPTATDDSAKVRVGTSVGMQWGTAVGQKQAWWAATPVVQPGSAGSALTAWTQTYATVVNTTANMTSNDLAAFTGGVVGFLDAAERNGIRTELNALRADVISAKGNINRIVDMLQLVGMEA